MSGRPWGSASRHRVRPLAFVSDHQAPENRAEVADAVLELCDRADLVIHDAQYTEEEYRAKADVGSLHGRLRGARRGRGRGPTQLVLFHHDPLPHRRRHRPHFWHEAQATESDAGASRRRRSPPGKDRRSTSAAPDLQPTGEEPRMTRARARDGGGSSPDGEGRFEHGTRRSTRRFREVLGHFATGVTDRHRHGGRRARRVHVSGLHVVVPRPPAGRPGPGQVLHQLAPHRRRGDVLRQHPGRGPGGAGPGLRRVGRATSSPASVGTRAAAAPPCSRARWRGWSATFELAHDAGDHELVIGRVREMGVRSGAAPRLLPGRIRPFRAVAVGSRLPAHEGTRRSRPRPCTASLGAVPRITQSDDDRRRRRRRSRRPRRRARPFRRDVPPVVVPAGP